MSRNKQNEKRRVKKVIKIILPYSKDDNIKQ